MITLVSLHPAFEKSMRSLSSEKEIQKNLEYHLIKNFNAVSLQFCKKISSYNTEISTKNFERNFKYFLLK
jgi:superoxide dismutase